MSNSLYLCSTCRSRQLLHHRIDDGVPLLLKARSSATPLRLHASVSRYDPLNKNALGRISNRLDKRKVGMGVVTGDHRWPQPRSLRATPST